MNEKVCQRKCRADDFHEFCLGCGRTMREIHEAGQRAKVVEEARTWVGTPYAPCADIKGRGVDCAMLLARVFIDTGLCPPFDPRPYLPDWHLHRSQEKYLSTVMPFAEEIAMQDVGPGDIIVFRYGRCYAHGAIVTKAFSEIVIVHAYSIARRVIEEPLSANHALNDPKRKPRFFSHWRKL